MHILNWTDTNRLERITSVMIMPSYIFTWTSTTEWHHQLQPDAPCCWVAQQCTWSCHDRQSLCCVDHSSSSSSTNPHQTCLPKSKRNSAHCILPHLKQFIFYQYTLYQSRGKLKSASRNHCIGTAGEGGGVCSIQGRLRLTVDLYI